MKNIVFTRKNDVDGAGCEVLSRLAFGEDVEFVYADETDIDNKFIKFFNIETYYDTEEEKEIYNVFGNDKLYGYDYIFLTGLTICPDVLYRIGRNSVLNRRFKIFDHHEDAKKTGAGLYLFNDVRTKNEYGKKLCSTRIYYENLVKKGILQRSKSLDGFVEVTRLLDSGEWQESKNKETAMYYGKIFSESEHQEYVEQMIKLLKDNNQKMKSDTDKEQN